MFLAWMYQTDVATNLVITYLKQSCVQGPAM